MSSNKQRQTLHALEETAEVNEIPVEALEDVDLTLPLEFRLDIFAMELLEHLSSYQRLAVAVKAARHQENHPRAEEVSRQMAYSRMMAALIQHEYPGAKAVADQIAQIRAKQAAEQRTALLKES